MTVKQALTFARELLEAGSIEDASLEAELLLRDTLKIDRVQLFLEPDRELSLQQKEIFWHRIKRRVNHEPSAYITGYREFYGLDFYVDSSVLIPRPETEILVEKALEIARNNNIPSIIEVGTGSGAVAVSLALNLPQVKIYATDISFAALRVALVNCRKHGVMNKISLICSDMLESLPESVDLIIANLPYVRERELNSVNSLPFEPVTALDGGQDGLDKIRALCLQISNRLRPEGHLLLEIGQGQAGILTGFLRGLFPPAAIEVTKDLSGIDRVVCIKIP